MGRFGKKAMAIALASAVNIHDQLQDLCGIELSADMVNH